MTGAFDKAEIDYESCPVPKSDLYLSFEAFANMRKVELPDDKKLVAELRSLERRRGKSGKDSVDHPPRGRDDRANAVAGLIYLLAKEEGDGEVSVKVVETPAAPQGHWITIWRA